MKRFRGYTNFKITVCLNISMMFFDAYKLEQIILSNYRNLKYTSLLKFKGHTELLSTESYELIMSSLAEKLCENSI